MTLGLLLRGLAIAVCLAIEAAAQEATVPNAQAAESVRGMQQQILSDPKMAEQVQSLRDNPAVQAVLNDPDIAAALSRGDIGALMADPKIQRLANEPAVRDLSRQVGPAD